MNVWNTWPIFAAAITGCEPAAGTSPEDMSARAHEQQSDAHWGASQEHSAKAALPAVPGAVAPNTPDPSEDHRLAREWHLTHAQLHANAARLLAEGELQECSGIGREERERCPLSEWSGKFESTVSGVAFRPLDAGKRDQTLRRMRCHQAFGRKLGFPRMPRCPLYLPATFIYLRADGSIAIETLDQERTPANEIRIGLPIAGK